MTELEIPPEADESTAYDLITEFIDEGAVVDVQSRQTTDEVGETPDDVRGTITGFQHGYLEIDGESPDGKGVRYDEVHLLTRVEMGGE
ncbi:hypothetical protein [Halovivax gelatinilyticus]|uniref:hypothetical protein n=1 Tax=Halovivax gelatinilyticus TaxID=2961597 RepID=UPI0020CA401E|nr:hypothetical protein [Halovivax gelatinilyticus]